MWTRKRELKVRLSIILIVVLLIAGCKKTALYHNLNEEEANEIIVILYESGIPAEKEKEIIQNETFWTITVSQKDLAKSRKILVDRNLPRKRELGLGGVYKEKGLIPTPDEQKARFLLAMKGELVNSLKKIPEVVDVDVVINIPTPEEFNSGESKQPTAAVLLKVRPDPSGLPQISEAKIQQFVANAIENLNPRNVSVIITFMSGHVGAKPGEKLLLPSMPSEKPAEVKEKVKAPEGSIVIAGITVSKESARRLKIYLSIFFLILVLMSAILVVNVVRTSRMKQELKALTEGEERPLLEGEDRGSPPRLDSGGDSGEAEE